jgi:hypothetical protein
VSVLVLGFAWACGQTPEPTTESRSAILPPGPPAAFLTSKPIGELIRGEERPRIANVQVVDLDKDGLADVLACDALKNQVVWIRQVSKDTYIETSLADIPAPAHTEAIDIDGDGDLDLVVAALGVLMPSNNRVGSILILENDGRQHFTKHVIADQIARVADARAGDLDGDGDLDLAVAGFGYDDGETSWFENKGSWTFEQHVLQRLSGPINTIVADINRDGSPDIVALVSQEWEEIWAFINDGRGHFTARMIWGSTNADFGSSWISLVDMDRDGDIDILYSNGDAFDYAPPNSRPWQGVQWLENQGGMSFAFHRIADLQGASSPQAVDLDGDGDIDVVVVTANNDWNDRMAPSLVWLENNGRLQFAPHAVSTSPTHLITLAVGDLDGDGQPDLVAGGMHISRPYDRMGRVTAWWNRHGTPQRR